MTAVAVVGLGAMGGRMAHRFAAAGHELVVWNRDRSKAGPLTDLGAIEAASPADAASRAEAVVVIVRDPQALRDVTEGPAGVAAGATAATTVFQMSTVDPDAVSRLESLLPAGAGLLDAPSARQPRRSRGGHAQDLRRRAAGARRAVDAAALHARVGRAV